MKRVLSAGFVVVLTAAVVVSTIVSGCDSSESEASAFEATTESDLFSLLASDLSLSGGQESHLRSSLGVSASADREPGFLWVVADSLARTLTDEQLERLLDRGRMRERIKGRVEDFDRGERRHRQGPGRAGRLGRFALEHLDLTDDQKAAIEDLRANARDQMEALLEQKRNEELSAEEFRTAASEIRETVRTEIDEILTEEQIARIEERREDRRSDWDDALEESRQVRNQVLGLTESEATQFDAIVDGLRESAQDLREQIRDGAIAREGIHEEIRSLRETAEAELEALLTEEQFLVVQIRTALSFRFGIGGPGFRRRDRG